MAKIITTLAASIIIAQIAGIIGSVFNVSNISTWYEGLLKPDFNPPNWLFGPIWILLYTLIGIAAFLLWRKKENSARKEALELYFDDQDDADIISAKTPKLQDLTVNLNA